ncbi:hypothetical protein [Flagellimonas sp.]|uniref:hypothetical protein n=1 Tax=Flagellimonas sp. TaxID=2058762 RepID=UPI003BA998A1
MLLQIRYIFDSKGVFVCLFVFLILIGNLRFSSMYVYYSLDREDFIERLCENKDRPALNCNGKCMLAKMLQAQTDDEQPMPVIGWEQVLVYFMDLPTYDIQIDSTEKRSTFFYSNPYSYCFSEMLIKPPMV